MSLLQTTLARGSDTKSKPSVLRASVGQREQLPECGRSPFRLAGVRAKHGLGLTAGNRALTMESAREGAFLGAGYLPTIGWLQNPQVASRKEDFCRRPGTEERQSTTRTLP